MSDARPLTAIGDEVVERHPGCRVEVLGGQLRVSALRDAAHARALTRLTRSFMQAGLAGGKTEVLQGIGVWLPTGTEDHAVPDLAVVESDIEDHLVENSCYDPTCFRLVLEVTSSYWMTDLHIKDWAYAEAKIPVYVVVDREHQRLHVLTEPAGDAYANHRVHAPGEIVALPGSIGAKVSLDVYEILKAGQKKAS